MTRLPSRGLLASLCPGRLSGCTLLNPKSLSSPTRSTHLALRLKRNMHQLTPADLNPAVLNVQYAVRGELAIRAEDLRNKLDAGEQLPFSRVINSNIGNPQQKGLDQPPITFTRQVSGASRRELPWRRRALHRVIPSAVVQHPLISAIISAGGGVDGIPPINRPRQGPLAQRRN